MAIMLSEFIPDAQTAFSLVAGAAIVGLTARFAFAKAADFLYTNLIHVVTGLGRTYKNVAFRKDRELSVRAVQDAFERDKKLKHVLIEYADMAVFGKRGEDLIIFDFTMDNNEMHDTIIYTQIKGMIGEEEPSTIFKFAKERQKKGDIDIAKKHIIGHKLDPIDADYTLKHAAMKCSWIRVMMNNIVGRKKTREALSETLHGLSYSGSEKGPQNSSQKGIIALRNKEFILVKPYTKDEQRLREKLYGTKRMNREKDGKHLPASDAFEIYGNIREAIKTEGITQETRTRALPSYTI